MLKGVLSLLRREYRSRPMARFAFWIVLYGIALYFLKLFNQSPPTLLWLILWAGLMVAAVYYCVRLFQLFQQRILWKVSWRLRVTYVLIGVVPIILIAALLLLSVEVINGQFAAYLARLKLRTRYDELQQLSRVVAHEAHYGGPGQPGDMLDGLKTFFISEMAPYAASYPELEIVLRVGSAARAFRLDGLPVKNPPVVPDWLRQEEFAGVVMDGDQLALRAFDRSPTRAGELTVILSEPFTVKLLNRVGQGIGPVGVLAPSFRYVPKGPRGHPGAGAQPLSAQGTSNSRIAIRSDLVPLPEPVSIFDFSAGGAAALQPIEWAGAEESRFPGPVLLYATSRIVTLNRELFSTLGQLSAIYKFLFVGVSAIFVVLEFFALIAAARLTKSITTTADRLQSATERVKAGDFSYRTNLPARDQLSSLGLAFDTMTASVESLLREAEEKTRLQSEVEIAKEVQRQLFPQTTPKIAGIELHAVCNPARGVSGDYYDFLKIAETSLGIVLGDVSGKGISAALLMASLQSALRAQVYDGARRESAARALSPAATVAQLNRQLLENTAAEKYATVFYAVYDATTGKLAYTNAGHPAPFLFRGRGVERLSIGGTPVGLFESVEYQQGEVQLEPGDLLLIFSDGVTEPENNYEEAFGEENVVEVVRRAGAVALPALLDEIIRSVNDWTGSPELQDDMTLIAVRACS